jgi:hypothetical protein
MVDFNAATQRLSVSSSGRNLELHRSRRCRSKLIEKWGGDTRCGRAGQKEGRRGGAERCRTGNKKKEKERKPRDIREKGREEGREGVT